MLQADMKTARHSLTRRAFLNRTAAAAAGGAATAWLSPAIETAAAKKPFAPRFAICNEMFGDWPFEKAFALAAEAGYKGIELAPFTVANDVTTITAGRRRKIRAQAKAAGLEILGLHWLLAETEGYHLTSPDPDVRRKTAAYLAALARFCAGLGGNLLIFGSPKQRNLAEGVTKEQGLEYAAEVIRGALPELEKSGVTLALEPLSPKTTNFMSTAAGAVELIEKVKSPRCRLILDCLAMSTEAAPIPEIIRRHRDLLVHCQVNDPNRQGPGFGNLDFVPILGTLREIDYRGWISVEVFDFSPGPERLARESIDYMRSCLAKG